MKYYNFDCIVIGSGAAGYNAACRLKEFGVNAAIVTEGVNCGTSRNTGSDKQTYYKLSLGGDSSDSVLKMAENLFAGGSVDGDNALCEAALSTRCFMNLCEKGVEFPSNRYGEYIGYKTDHDPYARATSAGPLTSRFMTEALEKNAKQLKVEVFDNLLAIEILKYDERVCGLLCIDTKSGQEVCFRCPDIIMATGGPAGIYADSVFPACHTGSTSLALLAGASAQNLTEWQYGLASVKPRWNVSGTYMQVLPRFVSIDSEGNEEEFLLEFFECEYEALSQVFLKGYQWPFDSKKVLNGSSVIDLLVYKECVLKGKRVYLDFTKNPFGLEKIDYEKLSQEAYVYLFRANALFGTPIERLEKMNAPAISLYRDKGVNIKKEYLEIALCAQHNNGGISVDAWWQSSIRGLFAAGECAGTHGVSRPGGSALNAGQVGSLRAAQFISQKPNKSVEDSEFENVIKNAKKSIPQDIIKGYNNIEELIKKAQRRMSDNAAAIRNLENIKSALEQTQSELENIKENAAVSKKEELYTFYKYRDILVTQTAVLTAMKDYIEKIGATRGSSLCTDESGSLREGLLELFRFKLDDGKSNKKIQQTVLKQGDFKCHFRPVRPLPQEDNFFENVWRGYRKNKNIY